MYYIQSHKIWAHSDDKNGRESINLKGIMSFDN